MISDVLFEAGEAIDYYLKDTNMYSPDNEIVQRIIKLRAEMKIIVWELDQPPQTPHTE